MADPVTMALILGATATTFQVVGTLQSARASENAANYNAAVARNNAASARDQADADARRQRILGEKALGGIRAAAGASGITMEGSPLDVLGESAANAELDVLSIKYKGELRAMGHESDATLDAAKASNTRTTGYLAAAGTLLEGGSNVMEKRGGLNKTPTGSYTFDD